jgi:hypothetical protein
MSYRTGKIWWRESPPNRVADFGEGLERVVHDPDATYYLIINTTGTRSYLEKWIGRPGSTDQVGYVCGYYTVERGREIFRRIDQGDPGYL